METPYRSDDEALAARLGELEARLREIRARRRELTGLDAEEAVVDREIADLRTKVRKTRLPLLDQVRVASPCNATWEDMIGDDRVRFCGQCAKNVYNLSGMTRDEAVSFVEHAHAEQHGGKSPCIRLHQRSDGTMLTADCPVGAKRRSRRRLVAVVAVGAGVAASALVMWRKTTQVVMGDMEVQHDQVVLTSPTMGAMAEPEPEPPPTATPVHEKMGRMAPLPHRDPPKPAR